MMQRDKPRVMITSKLFAVRIISATTCIIWDEVFNTEIGEVSSTINLNPTLNLWLWSRLSGSDGTICSQLLVKTMNY